MQKGKVFKGILLACVGYFFFTSIEGSKSWIDDILLDWVNFFALVAMLYLAAEFCEYFRVACVFVILAGILINSCKYYTEHSAPTQVEQQFDPERAKKCRGDEATWYTKLSAGCYW